MAYYSILKTRLCSIYAYHPDSRTFNWLFCPLDGFRPSSSTNTSSYKGSCFMRFSIRHYCEERDFSEDKIARLNFSGFRVTEA